MSCCNLKCAKWTLFSMSTLTLVLGILAILFWENLVNSIKRGSLNIHDSSTTEYKMWEATPIPMYIEFYLFNWTNADAVIKSKWTIKPSFEETGPYTFSEKHYRKNVVFNSRNYTVTHQTQRVWHFLPERSNGSLDDPITTINVIIPTVGAMVKGKHKIVRMGVDFFIEEKEPYLTLTKTAGQFLFEGYDDPLLELVHKLNMTVKIPFDKFGWFYGRNESFEYDGTFNIFDGADDLRKLGRTYAWNYDNRTEFYGGYCGQINGTSGELFYPIEEDKTADIFSPDICSTLPLVRSDVEDDLFGVKGHQFKPAESVFDNGTAFPEMECFSPGEKVPSGVRNVSQCKFGAPAFVSFPHFYLADEYYRDAVDGMKPRKALHETTISLEPSTGIPIRVSVAMQVNIRVESIPDIKVLNNVKTTFIPTLWFRQYATLSKDLASQAKLLIALPSIGGYLGYSLIGIGALLCLCGVGLVLKQRWKGSEEEQLLVQE